MTVFCIAFDPNRPPLDDSRVRRALAHALDCRRVFDAFGGSTIIPADGGIIPIGMAGYSPGIRHAHDIGLGQRYLAEAGYLDGKDFPHLIISIPPGLEKTPEEVKRQWHEALGIDISFQARFISMDPRQVPEIQAMIVGWIVDYPDPDAILCQSSIYNCLTNWGWKHERYEELIQTAASTPDRARRLEMYRQADHIIVVEETLVIPLGYGNIRGEADLVKPWITNYKRNALDLVRLKNIRIQKE